MFQLLAARQDCSVAGRRRGRTHARFRRRAVSERIQRFRIRTHSVLRPPSAGCTLKESGFRSQADSGAMSPGDFRVGDWLVQPALDRVQRDGQVSHLRPKSMQVLAELAAHAGDVVAREDLQRHVWRDVHVSEESLSHCIVEIRSVFGDDAKTPTYIETVTKHGYRLIGRWFPHPPRRPPR